MMERRIQIGKSYWQEGCDAGKAGKPACPLAHRYPGYMNGWHEGNRQRLAIEKSTKFHIGGHEVSLEELKADVAVAMQRYRYTDWTFTALTVKALIERIEELEKKCSH